MVSLSVSEQSYIVHKLTNGWNAGIKVGLILQRVRKGERDRQTDREKNKKANQGMVYNEKLERTH